MAVQTSPVNWLFIVELVVIVIVVVAFLFYWNRILGLTLSAVIRLCTWKSHNAYIDIGSLQISPLAGRIAFRRVDYRSSNLSLHVVDGNITFRYWIFRVRQGDSSSPEPNSKRGKLPCRIAITLEGFELFVYNRTPAYDNIVERMRKHEESEDGITLSMSADTAGLRQRKPMSRETTNSSPRKCETTDEAGTSDGESPPKSPDVERTGWLTRAMGTGLSWAASALPIELKVHQGSVVLGSDATPMVVILDTKHADGTIEMSEPRSPFDWYRLSINFNLREMNILMRTNHDYTGTLLSHGKRVHDDLLQVDPAIQEEPSSEVTSRSGFQWLYKKFPTLQDAQHTARPITQQPTGQWKGLARYRQEDDGVAVVRVAREERQYAKVTRLLTSSQVDLSYYYDVGGPAPNSGESSRVDPNDEIGNVDLPPEYGIDLTIHGGAVNYGPWTDRQRDALLKAFAPSIFFDTEPKGRLAPGEPRVATALVVNITIGEKMTLRIPTREPSKDYKYDAASGDVERKYGWLDVVVGANSLVTYTQAQVATQSGYDSMIVLHLDQLDIASSVNLQSFAEAQTCKLCITMPTPLYWNAQRNWGIDLTLDTPDILLMREHITLLSDLAKDWSSGTGDFHHFVPMHYNFRITLINYMLHMYINDFNIVDAPRSMDTNAFLDIHGPRIDAYVAVASTRYRPEYSTVPFTVDAKDVLVNVRLPSWDTHRTFNSDASLEVGRVGDIAVSGSYRYYAQASPEHQEKLKLDLDAENVAFKALGWVVRRMFCVKDNYFGTFTQFSTMQEFLEKFDHSPDSVGDPILEKYRPGRSDSFAVNLTVNVRDSVVVMSDEIYGCNSGIAIPVSQLQLDLRNNEFQMDMSVDVAPTHVVACDDVEHCYQTGIPPLLKKLDVVFIEGVDIKANRLFGPPPKGTTYVCLWELSIGHISAFLTPAFKDTLAAVGSSVGYNYSDRDNAPSGVYIAKTPPDATFVKLSVQRVTALLEAGSAGVAIELPQGVFMDTSSMASKACRSVQGLGIPSTSVHILRKREGHKSWEPVGSVSTGMSMDTYKVPPGWQEDAERQQEFLKEHDEPTKRVPYLYGEKDDPAYGRHEHEIYVPHPRPLEPSSDDETSLYTYEEAYDESSSAGEGDDAGEIGPPSVPLSRVSRRRRAMSRARAAEVESLHHEESSLGNESDSCSTFSASTSSSSDRSIGPEDPTTILEDKLSTFRKIHERARRLFAHDPSPPSPFVQEPGDLFEPLVITEGAVQKITLLKTTIEVTPKAIEAAGNLAVALNSIVPRAEVQLDQLLTYQTDALLKEGLPRNPKLLVIAAPQAEVRLIAGPEYGQPDSVVKIGVTSCSSRILTTPIVDSAKSVLQSTVAIGAFNMTAFRTGAPKGSLALSDIPDVPVPPEPKHNKLLPYTLLRALDVGVTVHQEPENIVVQPRVTTLEIHSATPGVPVISDVLDIWRLALKQMPKVNNPNTGEALLYDLLTQAITTGTALSLPTFMYEASYGLHLDDQRNIRRDVGWSVIQRLRYWMRQMDQHGQLHPNVIRPSGPDMAKRIVVDLAKIDEGFGLNLESVAAIPFLNKVLSKDLQAAGCAPPPVPNTLSVFTSLEGAELRHYGRQLQTDTIAWSRVSVESASVAYTNLKTWVENMPLSNIRSVISVRSIEFDLKDSSFAANEAIIRHIDTHRKEIKELQVVQAVEGASTAVLDVHLDRFVGGLTFGGMRGSTTLDHGQFAITLERSCKNMEDCTLVLKQHAVILNCAALEGVLAKCPDDLCDASAPLPMITTSLKGIKAGMATSFNSRDHMLSFQRILVGLEELDFNSRPQLKHFYEFVQEWRRDYWPLYRPYWKKLKNVLDKQKARFGPKNSPAPSPLPSPGLGGPSEAPPVGQRMVDAYIGKARLQVRGSEKLWLRWKMGTIYASFQGTPEHSMFGGKIDPQVIGGHGQEACLHDKQASIIRLPELTGTGDYEVRKDSRHLGINISVGMFTGIIKPIVLDRLLSLHQKVGKDVAMIVRELKQVWGDGTPQSQTPDSEPIQMQLQIPDTRPAPSVKEPEPSLPWLFHVQASIAGVRVGLRADGVPSTLMFEALDLQASASNINTPSILWMAKANHVGLVLIRLKERGAQVDYSSSKPLEGARSASMVFDFSAEEIPGNLSTPSRLSISFTRVHTVMHIAALSEVSDLIKSWSADLTVLREVHKEEVEDVKEEASKVLKKIEGSHMSTTSTCSQESSSTALETWFRSRVLTVEIHGFGIAIPLDEDASLDLSGRHNSDGPALLFSIRLITLRTSRTETARFRVLQSSLAFVNGFDPGQPDHFVGDLHVTNNRMTLPKIDAEAQLTSTSQSLLVTAHCQATDFKLSLTPDIADGVGKLIDLYELGKGQLEVLEKEYLSEWSKLSEVSQPESLQSKYDTQVVQAPPKVVTLRTSFRFDSGLVELHRPMTSTAKRTHSSKKPAHDLVVLPTVSLWVEYAGPTNQEEAARTLLFNMAVHESKNELRPTILPFFIELVGRIERRAKSRVPTSRSNTVDTPAPSQVSVNRSPEMPLLDVGERADRAMAKVEEAPTGKIRVRVTLRIDKSELKLSCTPDSNAYVDLKWESGGFVASTLLGGKHTTTLAGSVSGVTAYLSHEFAETGRGCIEAGAKDLAFSVALCSEEGNTQRGLSIVVDTGVSAQFQLEAFSAWLIFMSVWVDAAPKLDLSNKQAPASSMTSTSAPISSAPASTLQNGNGSACGAPVRAKLGVAALVRFRSIDFDANVAVTQARLEMTPVVLRTVTDGEETELDLKIGTTSITAKGDVSGNVTSESLKFHTIRRSSRSAASFLADPTVLTMSIDGGDLRGAMFIGDMNIVRFRLEPSRVTLADNWKAHAEDPSKPVSLDFIVNAGQFTGVLKLPVIPRLLGHFYSIFDLIESQKKIAAQRSESFKNRQAKKTDTNKNVVVLPSATAPSSPTVDDTHAHPRPIMVRTAQLMKFELKGIDIGLFVDDYDDGTVADFLRFYIGQIRAELSRSTDSEGRPERALELHVDFIEWQTSDGRRAARVETHDQTPAELIQASMKAGYKVVVVLPRMKLDMRSTQKDEKIFYNFHVLWGETDGDVKVIPKYFSYALRSFRKLIRGIETQQTDRAKRAGVVNTTSGANLRRAAKALTPAPELAEAEATKPPAADASKADTEASKDPRDPKDPKDKPKEATDKDKDKDAKEKDKGKGKEKEKDGRGKDKSKASADAKAEPPKPSSAEGVYRMSLGGLDFFDRDSSTRKVPLPKLKALGETTGDAAAFFDWFRRSEQTLDKAAEKLPAYSHRFVTLPLEDGMDMLLKLYQKQLPELEAQEYVEQAKWKPTPSRQPSTESERGV